MTACQEAQGVVGQEVNRAILVFLHHEAGPDHQEGSEMDCLIDLVFLIVAIIGILTDRQVHEKTGGFCAHIWECLKAAAE